MLSAFLLSLGLLAAWSPPAAGQHARVAVTVDDLPYTGGEQTLGEARLEEWKNLVDVRGPFRDYRLLGSRPLGRAGVVTLARLRFRSGIVTISYFWGDRGSGRIRGSFQHLVAFRPPLGLVVGRARDGGLVAHDPVGGETLRGRLRERDGGLHLEVMDSSGSVVATARRSGLAGWIPPF